MKKGNSEIKRILEIEAQLDLVKPLYAERDALILKLAEKYKHGEVIFQTEDKEILFKDNFAEKNTAFKATGIQRFDIVEKKKAK